MLNGGVSTQVNAQPSTAGDRLVANVEREYEGVVILDAGRKQSTQLLPDPAQESVILTAGDDPFIPQQIGYSPVTRRALLEDAARIECVGGGPA